LNVGLARGCKLTLVSAPAGFGKSTLVSDWIASCGCKAAWLSLDEGDNDFSRFLLYFISALQTINPNLGEEIVGSLQSSQPPSMELVLSTLLNEITANTDNFVFVLDDYHTIDSRTIDKALGFLLDHLPAQLHLVITTREDPELPLARLRGGGKLTELRAADLQFTQTEAAEFLNRIMGLNLSEVDIAALETRTEGWIAGLQMAAISMQGLMDVESFIQSFTGSHRFVMDYLVEEVLHRQTEAIQDFLLGTSVLDRLCGPLCEAVLGTQTGSGQETLEYLERSNLFIIPLDNERRWYRYHHLFMELLRQRLLQRDILSSTATKPDSELINSHMLNRRASEWYERMGSAPDAIHHALAAKDFGRAAALIELAVPEMRRNRQEATVTELGWLKALPEEMILVRPVLSVAYAYASFGAGEFAGVDALLQNAERLLNLFTTRGETGTSPAEMVVVDEIEYRRLPGMIALLRTAQALARGDMHETEKNAKRVLEVALESDHILLGGASSTLGLAAWARGDLDVARRMIIDGMENVRRAGYITAAIGDAITLADIQIAQGHLRAAMTTYEQALGWAMVPGTRIMRGAADLCVGMSSLFCEHNDLGNATQQLVTSRNLGELAGMPQNPYRWCAAMARIKEAQGDLNGALELLDEAERLYDGNFSPNVRPIAARKARVWAIQCRMDEALKWVREQKLSADDNLTYLREFDHITLARILMACCRVDGNDATISEVMSLLERLHKAADEGGRAGSAIEILVLQAIAYQDQGNLSAALLPLKQALSLAAPEGYVRIFLDEGADMMKLLREASVRQILPDYTGRLLAEFENAKQIVIDETAVLSVQHLIDLLSERELEVLKLLKSELSGPEIAQQLCVSINTFRTHTKQIFTKLGVNDRRAAIRRANELNL
jgi:LuxR family maltose regulon positive regulatory protein